MATRRIGWGLLNPSTKNLLNVYFPEKGEAISTIEEIEGREFNPKKYKHTLMPIKVVLTIKE